ncbi:MAG: hypothetical protein WD049_08605 [Candidatus Paceibacterota bacterium]
MSEMSERTMFGQNLKVVASVGFLAGLATFLFWSIWYALYGSVPVIEEIVWETASGDRERIATQLPVAISHWWDVAAVVMLASWVMLVVWLSKRFPSIDKSVDKDQKMLTRRLEDGLVFGLINAVIGLIPGWYDGLFNWLVISLFTGLIICLILGLVSRVFVWPAFTIAYAPILGAFVGIVYGLSIGLIAAVAMFVAMATVQIAVTGGYYTCRVAWLAVLRSACRLQPVAGV